MSGCDTARGAGHEDQREAVGDRHHGQHFWLHVRPDGVEFRLLARPEGVPVLTVHIVRAGEVLFEETSVQGHDDFSDGMKERLWPLPRGQGWKEHWIDGQTDFRTWRRPLLRGDR